MSHQRRGWRYFATRLNGNGTETTLDMDLPLEDVSIDEVLSGYNAITANINPRYARLIGSDGYPLLNEWGTAIYAENDGDIRAAGILTHSGFDGPNWALECTGFAGYASGMPYVGNGYKGIRVDPLQVVRVIWNHLQTQPGGNIGLEIDTTTTGGKVTIGTELVQAEFDSESGPLSYESGPYTLNWYTNHDLGADIDDLASGDAFDHAINDTELHTGNAFDYSEEHSWRSDGTIKHFLRLGYPKLGRRREDLRFVYGVNLFDNVAIERDGALYASGTLVLGAGEGSRMIHAVRERLDRPGGRLRRLAVVQDDTITSLKRADARADAENQWRAQLDDVSTFITVDHPNAKLGAAQVGDEIRLEGQGDWLDLDMWVRILAINYQPAAGNQAQYTVARTDKLMS